MDAAALELAGFLSLKWIAGMVALGKMMLADVERGSGITKAS